MLMRRPWRERQTGMSLVELMVGITVGMFVAAAAATIAATQLTDNRRLLLELQIQQDLRSAADIITRDLRRAGAWGVANSAQQGVWTPDAATQPIENPMNEIAPGGSSTSDQVTYSLYRSATASGPFKFKLNVDTHAIQSYLGSADGWQDLTDKSTMQITSFAITSQVEPPIQLVCQKLCADDTQDCWPTVQVRSLQVSITGQSVSDPAIRRTINSRVRVMNDNVDFKINASTACPS